MCRLLYVRQKEEFKISYYLKRFAAIAEQSQEYQGHGWGCAFLKNGQWTHYKNSLPVWKDDLERFGNSSLLIAHARSAFRDEHISVENNMPFYDGNYVFIFNGELHGVKIRESGRIGAEKIFNFMKRFDRGNMQHALKKGRSILTERSRYIRAMNIIIASKEKVYVLSQFNENPDYYTLHYKQTEDKLVICSAPLDHETNWKTMANRTERVFG